jgi:hypothetical protein
METSAAWMHRVAGLTGGRTAVVTMRPFRAPHHTISEVGVMGGGQRPMPGEVSLSFEPLKAEYDFERIQKSSFVCSLSPWPKRGLVTLQK